jgi:hypothetical protein
VFNPFGSGSASWTERAERVVQEAIRRIKLEAKNDTDFVPAANDLSSLLAVRHYVVPPIVPERGHDDASDVLAGRVFGARDEPGSGSGTPLNIPHALVQRDVNGDFAARRVQVEAIKATVGSPYDFQLLSPAAVAILDVPTGTINVELNGELLVDADAQFATDVDVAGICTASMFVGDLTGTADLADAITSPIAVTGSRATDAWRTNLIAALVAKGIITDTSSA